MNAMRRRLHAVTWFALVAMWALALAPSVSHALARAQGEAGRWAEVCTPQGLQRVTLGDEGPATPATEGAYLAHCAFCGLGGADGAVLPTAAPAGAPDATAGSLMPVAPQALPCTLADWSSPPARAPPGQA
jgi:Protein of unknown function (DUF2946)